MSDEQAVWAENIQRLLYVCNYSHKMLEAANSQVMLFSAYLRDSMLTPLEAAHAGMALDEVRAGT